MSDRERWIVYPLLFFALLLGARDRVAPPNPLKCDALECRSLKVISADGREFVKLFPTSDGALMRFYSRAEYDMENQGERISLKPTQLEQALEIGADATGGYATLFGPDDAPAMKLGHHDAIKSSGLIASTNDGETLDVDGETWGPLMKWPEPEEEVQPDEQAEEKENEEAAEEKTEEAAESS